MPAPFAGSLETLLNLRIDGNPLHNTPGDFAFSAVGEPGGAGISMPGKLLHVLKPTFGRGRVE